MAGHRTRRPEAALRESTYYILAVLTDRRAKSSSVIRKSVFERSAGYVELPPPNVIGLLKRYAEKGFIEIINDADVGCKLYRLTKAGYALWEADRIRLRHRLYGSGESNSEHSIYRMCAERAPLKGPAHEG